MTDLPTGKMRAVVYKAEKEYGYEANFEIPKPGPGEVLIKVECACLYLTDIQFMNAKYKG